MSIADKYGDVFRQEAEERLAEMEEVILLIESNPDDTDAINRLFRAAHTIKGSGAMYGFDEMAGFTHHLETLLEKVRDREVAVSKPLIDQVLASRDQIIAMLAAAHGGPPVNAAGTRRIVAALKSFLPGAEDKAEPARPAHKTRKPGKKGGKAGAKTTATWRIVFRPNPDFFRSGNDPLLALEELSGHGECEVVAQTDHMLPFEDFNPEECQLYWDIILTTASDLNAIKDVFIFIEDMCAITIQELGGGGLLDAEAPPPRLGEILVERGYVSPEAVKEELRHQNRLGDLLTQSGQVSAEKVAAALLEQEALAKQQAALKKESLRVPALKLDALVNLVGELVVNQARLSQISSTLESHDLATSVEEANRLAADLRDIVLNIRMMPIGTTFSRFTRLVRDLSGDLSKEVQLITEGAETEMDKTVIDRLVDPLVHLIRNSLDHGIEQPTEREAAGKPRRGTIRLVAQHKGDRVVISVEDDGRGLNRERIHRKAVEKGLVPPDKLLTETEIMHLIFHPGFSTAAAVTDVSGRGVGMDVVKREIAALRGSVDISSRPGAGTTIALGLPLTLAIIDGLLVRVADQRFVIPLSVIEECLELNREHFVLGTGRNVIAFRGQTIPVIRLREVFEVDAEKPPWEETVVTNCGGEQIGFVVDRVIGNYQTVIKSLGKFYQNVEAISGATILGDGDVALVLDVAGLLRMATDGGGEGGRLHLSDRQAAFA
ncbi:MAG: chemotaxis protein CheA [Alphaproteobacteria bacterium]|nr:chemotaxis protein CheA [Alphaproteobacteria bacterium]